jgi:hypothetical protein
MKIKNFRNEEWKEIHLSLNLNRKYAISNYGRVIKFTEEIEEGELIKGRITNGYPSFSFKIKKERSKTKYRNYTFYIHKLVAEYFIPNPHMDKDAVIHVDLDKTNNHYGNLKWASKADLMEHHRKNPLVRQALFNMIEGNKKRDGRKLTTTQVIRIKKKLADPNRKTRLKIIAQEFGISEMQLYRIKTGENWGHIEI